MNRSSGTGSYSIHLVFTTRLSIVSQWLLDYAQSGNPAAPFLRFGLECAVNGFHPVRPVAVYVNTALQSQFPDCRKLNR